MKLVTALAVVTLSAAPLAAQTSSQPPAPRAVTAGALMVRLAQGAWNNAKRDIVESADQMPEADYAYKPVASVRTFGQILAHVADSNYYYCARAKGETAPSPDGKFEKDATTKAAIVKALAESVAYCDGVYAALTDASVTEMVTAPGARNAVRYTEYSIGQPHGVTDAGERRFVVDEDNSNRIYYTWTHYGDGGKTPAFVRIR